ncbi:MAG: peptidylprolyl isomerase, partial [Alphaproteobacteria bacterium]|nr:peptidylprolyl isomerase [Alphaproteobacteria bacterium]
QDEVKARHILLKTEGEAREVIGLITAGNDFAEVAKQRSTGPSAAQGGDLGFFRQSDMVKPFADAAFALKPGEVTPNPVKTEFGWHVIKVEDHRTGQPPPYERVRNQIAQDISQQVTAAAVKQARAAAKIKRFTLDGQPVPGPSAAPAQPAAPKKQ